MYLSIAIPVITPTEHCRLVLFYATKKKFSKQKWTLLDICWHSKKFRFIYDPLHYLRTKKCHFGSQFTGCLFIIIHFLKGTYILIYYHPLLKRTYIFAGIGFDDDKHLIITRSKFKEKRSKREKNSQKTEKILIKWSPVLSHPNNNNLPGPIIWYMPFWCINICIIA